MTLARKKLIIIVVAVVAFIAIITAIIACNSGSNRGGADNVDMDNKPQDPYSCIVTFDAFGGTINGYYSYQVTIEKNTTVARPSEIPQRDGYEFWGWNATGSDGDPMWKFDAEKILQDMTIYAVWVREYTVTFYADEGVFDDGTRTCTVTAAHGAKVTAPKVTSYDEYMELQGWTTELGTEFDLVNNGIYGNLYLYAKWDIKKDIKRQLAPFKYARNAFGYTVTGVVDDSVSEITIPTVVTDIDYAAFSNCHNLVSVTMHDGVTYIGHYAFQYCEKLKSINLPLGLEEIKIHTFDGCTSLENILLPNTVTSIGEYAFNGCSSLKSIQIPSGVTEIKKNTFYGCTALEQVKLGDNVTEIGMYAFRDCAALVDFQIPAAIEELGRYAFEGCSSLKSVTIPATCKSTGMNTFRDCTALTSVELHCETVDDLAFWNCTALTDITFGAEVRTIDGAFFYCEGLVEVNIPGTVKSLAGSFCHCTNLRTVTIGDGLEEINASVFVNCYNLRNVTIGNGVKEIGFRAFEGCVSLLSITIPSSVETIETWAFNNCDKLVEVYNLSQAEYSFDPFVTMHTDVEEESVIRYTADGFAFFANEYGYTFLLDYLGDDEDIVLPDNLGGDDYIVYNYALAYKPQLRSVEFSAGVNAVYSEILRGSDNVTSLTVSDKNTTYHAAGNCVIKTADKKFVLGCKTSVIPTDGSVTAIVTHVLCGNATITEFSIPETVTVVEYGAFADCNGIIRTVGHVKYVDKWAVGFTDGNSNEKLDLKLESGTIGIANYAFRNDKYIQSVEFNAGLKYVGTYAFDQCVYLTEAVIPQSVTFIQRNAFNACPDTLKIYYCGTEEQWNAIQIVDDNAELISATKYFYSETQIEGVNCWHYNDGGKPTTVY